MGDRQDRRPFLKWSLAVTLSALAVWIVHPPIGAGWFLAFVAYVPFFAMARHWRVRGMLAAGFVVGAVSALGHGYWCVRSLESPVLVLLGLAGYLGFFWAMAGLLLQWFLRRDALGWWALGAVVIPSLEWLRSQDLILALPYVLTSHSISENLWFSQWIEGVGFWGLALLLCWSSLMVLRAFSLDIRWGYAWVVLLGGMHLVGAWRMHVVSRWPTKSWSIVVVQEFSPRLPDHDSPMDKRILLERILQALKDSPESTLILPESTVDAPWVEEGATIESNALLLDELVRAVQHLDSPPRYALVGLTRGVRVPEDGYRNGVGLIDLDTGTIVQFRDKDLAVPIGEGVPFSGVPVLHGFGGLVDETDSLLVRLDTRASLEIPDGPRLAVCICYEHLLPSIWSRRELRHLEQTDVQVILADLRWFHYADVERRQSRAARRLSAIEHRRPILYAANGGSEWLDPAGRMVESIGPNDAFAVWMLHIPHPLPWAVPCMFRTAFPIAWAVLGLCLASIRPGTFRSVRPP